MRDDAVALVEELNAELRSDKVTRRKAALKQLETHLASADLAKLLDRTTLQLDAGLGGDVKLTWAGLCSSLMQCVSAEIHASAGKKAPANKLVASILRRLVATAEDPKRRARVGVVAPLLRRAGKLFAHVLEILRQGPPEFATEYTHTLRALLAEPRYCARVKASIYEELVELYKERLAAALAAAADDDADDAGAGAGGDAANRTAHTFLELLRRCPHDMSPRGELHVVVTFLGSALAGLADADQLEGHLPVTLAQALNACLARGGPDLAPATTLARLARDLMPLVDKALLGDGPGPARGGVHGDARKKQKQKQKRAKRTRLGEAVTATCRLLLALGGTRACPEALRALAATLERAIATQPEACAADIDGGNGNAELALEPARAAACALAADVFAAQCTSPGARGRWTSAFYASARGPPESPEADGSAAVGEKRGREDASVGLRDGDGDGDGILARARRRRLEGEDVVVVDANDGNESAEPVMVRLGALASGVGASSWGPVLCAALIRHAAAIPPRLTRAWLDRLVPALVEIVAAGAAADRAVAARAAWIARCLRELSAVERRGRARHPSRWQAEVGDTSGAWAKVRACLVQWLPSFASNETLTSEALVTFAAASAPELAPGGSAPPHPKFWKLRAMSTSATDDANALVPPSTAALRAAAAAAATGGARKENWHKARLGWVLLRLRPPPAGERINFYQRRGGDGDPGAGAEPMRAVIAATRAVLLNAPLDDELDVDDDGGDVETTAGSLRRFWSREWVRRPRFGSDEWAAEEALEEMDERAAPRFAVLDTDGADDDAEDGEEEEDPRRRRRREALARDAVVVAPSASALAETADVFVETLRMIPAEGPVAALRVATVAIATASEIVATRRASRDHLSVNVSASARDVSDDWAPTGAVLARAADAVVAAARALREASAAAFRGDADSNGDAGMNLAALDDACQLASEALPVAARAGLLDDVGDGTRTTLHDATRELVVAVAAVAADAADATIVEARRARDAADARVEGGAGVDAARDDEMFDDDLDAMPASRAMTMTQGGAPSTYLATQLTRATPPSAQTLPSVGASPDATDASAGASAADAAALAALAAVSAIGATFPAAAAAAAAALLERVVEPVEAPPPEEDEEDAEQTEGMVCVLVGGERVADAATRALCALSGTDASEEPSATGGKGAGVADLADRAIAGLEAALVGPSGRSGADDAVDRAPEARRAWLLTQTATLAEGLLRRRQRRRRRGRRRAGDPSTATAARRRGLGPRDVASVAAESSQTARLYPRLRFLVEDIAGLPDCVDLENNGVGDAKKFAPASLRAPASRVALSRALRALLELDPDYFQPPLAGALVALLEDDSGAVRRAAGQDIARVLAVFEPSDQPSILREKIARRLCLCVALPEPGALGRNTREDEADEVDDDEDEDGVAGGADVDARSGKVAPVFSAAARLVGGAAAEASAAACKEETSMLALGHLAAASPAVEARCVFLLLAHAASKARDGAKNSCGAPRARVVARAADILSRLAEALGYGSRREFVMRHARTVGALWVRAEMSPHRLFRLFDVRSAAPASARQDIASERLARLSADEAVEWEKAIVPPAVLAGDACAVRAASDAHWRRVGRGDVANTMQTFIAPVVAHLFLACSSARSADAPDESGADPEEKARAVARRRLGESAASALEGPLLARAGTETRSVDTLAFGNLAAIASEMMLLTQCPHDGDAVRAPSPSGRVDSSCAEAEALAPPYRTPDEVVRAGLALPEAARGGLASGAAGRVALPSSSAKTSDAPSMWTGDAAHRCVSALHAELCASRHPRHRKRAFAGLEALRRVLGDDAYRPSTARQLCHVALPHVGDRSLGPSATRFLEGVFGPPVARRDWSAVPDGAVGLGADALADALQPTVSTLVAAAERGDERGRRHAADAATKLLASLVGGAGAEGQAASVRAAAAALTPLPKRLASLGAEVIEAHARVTRATAMPDRLRALVERAPRLAPKTRALALRDGIREALERSREIREGGASAARDAWRLAALAADAGDASLVARAGELLATLGPFATEGHDDDERRHDVESEMGAVVDPSDPALAAAVLRRLSGLMCDASADTTRAAVEDARDVLAAKASRAALRVSRGDAFLSPLEREYLAPLAPAASLDPDDAEKLALDRARASARSSTDAGRAPPSVEDRRTWIPGDASDLARAGDGVEADDSDGRTSRSDEKEPIGVASSASTETRRYETWIRKVVDALIEHCDSPLLRLARRAARAHASLAELLLPAAFVDIAAKHPEGGGVHAAVSGGVKLCLEADGGGCARATRALLGALDAMRFRSAAAMRRPTFPDAKAKRSSSSGEGGRRSAGTRDSPSPPEGWRRVYWVEVDYLVAAKAARRARAPLTATLLTEAWLEDVHGTVSLDEAAAVSSDASSAADVACFAAKEERVPEHVGLLLEAQASLSEPDGIYGLLRSNALPVQLRLYEREGAWGQALAGFDQGARFRVSGNDAAAAGSRARLMDILRQMGCLHVLDVYVNALPPEEAASPQATAARFEAAWRVGQWDLKEPYDRARADAADAGSARNALGLDRAFGPNVGVGSELFKDGKLKTHVDDADDAAAHAEADFHRDLHGALATLRAGDVASTSSRLDAIRGALVRRATTEGVEARETSRTAVIRLRMLDDVADAAKLWRAYRGERDGVGVRAANKSDARKVAAQATRSTRETWRRRVGALAERSFRIAEPLLAVHGVVLRELGDDEALVAHLAETASLARKAGESAEGLRAIHQARALAAARAEAVSSPSAPPEPAALRCEPDDDDPRGFARHAMSSPLARWRLEEAKLLWASGRDQMAIGVGRHLLEATSPGVMAKLRLGGSGSGSAADRRGSESLASQQDGAHQDPRFYETACLVSKWQGATRTESSRSVLQQHASIVRGVNAAHVAARNGELRLPPSSRNVPPGSGHVARMLRRAHLRLAQFADQLYAQLEARLTSPEWAQSEALRRRNELELQSMKIEREEKRERLARRAQLTREEAAALDEEQRMLHRRIFPLDKQVQLDREETQTLRLDRVRWLVTALQAYRRTLEAGAARAGKDARGAAGADQRVVFRIVDIWFTVCGGVDRLRTSGDGLTAQSEGVSIVERTNDEVSKLVARATVPSSNFLPLSYQICGRLGTAPVAGNAFPEVLRKLVDRMCAEHPYHVLYHVQALRRGDQVGGSGTSELYSTPREKIDAARDCLDAFARHSKHHAAMVREMDVMIEAYIDLARHPVDARDARGGDGGHQIPAQCKKRALRDLRLVPIVTASLPVDPTMRYAEGSFPHFVRFADTCRLVGGINQPKLVEALGSDGVAYKQLAKAGNDDLRQDAVMQQLFELVNRLLLDDLATRERKLRVGTYRVVPLTPAAGVLEWVDNTTLLSEYLLGGGAPGDANAKPVRGAHERYRPRDLKHRECRDRLAACQTREQLRKAYDEVCSKFKPVMHHFFLENFPSPRAWWESRLTYTRSVAVNSMVGYVVGLGDRHSSNILLDKTSAEMIHIDLGVAFEQGKCLKTPETVPFRLTRDVVDGFGACGVEGVMRRCSEETLRVLRANKNALTTVVAVLVHDPILKWAVSPERAAERQREVEEDEPSGEKPNGRRRGETKAAPAVPAEGNLDAERALMRVAAKLDGYEGSELRSVAGQVQQLLQDARDPDLLCALYPGWAPWV
jgi:ataxia telangiectasia mutated family protein